MSALVSARYLPLVLGVVAALLAAHWLALERAERRGRAEERAAQAVERLEGQLRAARIREEARDEAASDSDYDLCVFLAGGLREACARLRRPDPAADGE